MGIDYLNGACFVSVQEKEVNRSRDDIFFIVYWKEKARC